ncbi:lysis protein [Phytobacter sp. AG2a]
MTSKAWLLIGIELLLSALIIYALLGRISEESRRADNAESLAKQRQETINDMTVRQRDVAALDAKYTGELADAKANIDQLERDVAAGKRRLQVSARCPANGTASAPGVDDATSPRLTDAAERDYFTLRERIETVTKQLTALQVYVREQCLK